MPVTHVNRYRETFYLHVGWTKNGKPRYWVSSKADGNLVDAIPDDYEIYEIPDARVYLRKKPIQIVTPEEVGVVKEGVKRYAPDQHCTVDVRKEDIIVCHSERGNLYQKMLRFTLDDEKDRTFRVQRWCFKGSNDDWIDLSLLGRLVGKLPVLVHQICPHLGRDSFYNLM